MKRLLALMLCAVSLGVMGQNGVCCDLDGVNYVGPAVCLGVGEPNGTWSDADGVACDPDCSNYDPCDPAGECYNPNSPGCTNVGCTDPTACNYDPTAEVNDGSCEYLSCSGCQDPAACDYDDDAVIAGICDYDSCAGCTNPEALNYDATAFIDDGSCEIPGCTIPVACNFYAGATVNDGSCDFVSCLELGCTEASACNYDPEAILNDGSCEYQTCIGCTNPIACDFDPDATIAGQCDHTSCIGCTDSTACNYDSTAFVDDGSCLDIDACGVCGGPGAVYDCGCTDIPDGDCDCLGNQLDALGICGGFCEADVDNDGLCDATDPCVGAFDNCGVCNGPGPILECGCAELPEGDCDCNGNQVDVLGVCGGSCSADADADGVCDDVDDCVGALDACGLCNGPGAIYECGCADIPEGDCDCDGNTVDLVGVCGGSCTSDHDNNGVCDDQEVFGCAYPLADNYSPEVTHDDGSCVFPCVGEVNANVFDWDGDYSVTVTDFLMMLTVFGDVDVDFDGVWDSADECIDTEACNYNADPSEPCQYIDVLGICGGGCLEDADADGVCDDVDDCIGVVDECGVCNGPGATEVVIEDITILYDSVYAEQIDTWFVFEVGADTTFSYQCDPSLSFSCGDPVSYQGYDYETVQIGEQCWFAENLRAENYRNGDVIPTGLSDSEWYDTTSGAVVIYGEGGDCEDESDTIDACDPTQSLNEFGRLYNWYAVDDTRGLCLSGWHVPSDEEWMTMEMALGMSEEDANGEGWRGTDQGRQMKTDYGWSLTINGTNTSGFSALPGGSRNLVGDFKNGGKHGSWWSSSPVDSRAWNRELGQAFTQVRRHDYSLVLGYSIRCIKD
ncbi:fibrobacter succinogenes major paralogous domain-containing protein [Flavobacteriales bacterium]|nr:fibrobacter succinogenes major paralogous domain-containing protein [Flavobacteriales bacterium]